MTITNTIKSLKRRLTNQNAFANLADVNEAVSKSVPSYTTVSTYSGNLTGMSRPVPRVSQIVNSVNIATIGRTVTSILAPGQKLEILDMVNQGFSFSVQDLKIIIGYGVADWDGGDLQLYLGNNLLATIPAANLLNTTGAVNASKTIGIKINNIVELATGTYSPVTGMEMTNAPTVFNLRSTAVTTAWNGEIAVIITLSKESNDCGIDRCDATCTTPWTIYCSLLNKGCATCPTLGYTGADVSPV